GFLPVSKEPPREAAMKFPRFYCFILLAGISLAPQSNAQNIAGTTQSATVPVSDAQAVLLANEAQLALTGGASVSDVTMIANSLWIAGGTRASGTATLKAKGTAEGRVDISANTVKRSEIRNDTNGPDGRWAGADGAAHPIALHNCWGPAAWFSPH